MFFGVITLSAADLSVPEEQVSYSILAFNGRDYSYFFTIEDTEVLYFIEGQDNYLSLSKSLFYFWPITNEWKVDNEHLNYSYMGILEILKKYLVNLPAGEYDIRFKTEVGFIVEGSEKKVVIYKKNTETSVGYEIIPENKWTRSVVSDRPESVIYLDGSTDLYLQCFYQDQYNDFFHSKTLNVTNKGNPESMKWFRVIQIENAGIELKYENGSYTTINAEPFIVEQKEGSSLGYSILPYKAEIAQSGAEPSLIAFHLPLDKDVKKIQFHAVDEDGNVIRNSYRQVRVLSVYRGGIISLVLSLLPVLLYVLIIIRYRYFRK